MTSSRMTDAYARSVARRFVAERLEGAEEGIYDVEAIVTALIESGDSDYQSMSTREFNEIADFHTYP